MSRIGIIGYNSINLIKKVTEIWNAGNSVVLIDPLMPVPMQFEIMRMTKTELCFIDDSIYQKKQYYKSNDNEISFQSYIGTTGFTEVCIESLGYKTNYTDNEAVVIFSSGTTGISKGIILTHKAININADAIIEYMGINKNDTLYIAKPFSHSSTFVGEILVSLKVKNRIVLAKPTVPPRVILKNLSQYNCTFICLNPYLLKLITEEQKKNCYNLNSLKKIYVSGSRLYDDLWLDARHTFGNTEILNVYGLTEAGPRVSAQRGNEKNNSVGKPISNVKVIITDAKGNKKAPLDIGIVSVKSPSMMKGYLNSSSKESVYKNWLNTGDIGYTDEDGYLYIIDRMSDVIVINSHNIIPTTIEDRINSIEGIDSSCVFKASVNKNDVLCCVYTGNEVSSLEIRRKLSESSLNYEIPCFFKNIKSMPMTLTKKMDRNEIKKKFLQEFLQRIEKI